MRFLHILLLFLLGLASWSNLSAQEGNANEEVQLKSMQHLINGINLYHLGEMQGAVAELRAALKADVNNHAASFYLSQIAFRMGDFSNAVSLAKKSTQLAPHNVWYWQWLAQIYIYQHQLQEAATAYWQAIKTGEAPIDMYFNLIEICEAAKLWEQALTALDSLENKLGPSPLTYAQRAYLLLATERPSQALQTVETGLKLFPSDTTLLLGKVRLLAQLNRKEEALRFLDSLPATVIPYHIKMQEKVRLLIETEKLTEALLTLKQYAKMPEGNPTTKLRLLETISNKTQSTEDKSLLRQVAESIVKAHPNLPEAWALLGDILNNILDSPHLAIPAYLRSIEIDSFYAYPWLRVATVYLLIDSTEQAYHTASRASRLFPENSFFLVIASHACYIMKNWECVVTSAEKALSLNVSAKTAEELLVMMGDSYYFLGNYEKSNSSYERALKLNPNNDVALNNYAYFLIVRGERLEKARKMIKKALKAKPKESSYLDTYGWYWFMKNRHRKAYKWIQKAIDAGGHSPEIYEHMGDVLYHLGRKEEAVKWWKKAIEAGGTSPSLHRKATTGEY